MNSAMSLYKGRENQNPLHWQSVSGSKCSLNQDFGLQELSWLELESQTRVEFSWFLIITLTLDARLTFSSCVVDWAQVQGPMEVLLFIQIKWQRNR